MSDQHYSLNICHVVASLSKSAGGPPRTVSQLAASLARLEGVSVDLISQKMAGDDVVDSKNDLLKRSVVESRSKFSLLMGLPLKRSMLSDEKRLINTSIVHSHGIWLPANHWAAVFSKKAKVPLVIHPRGMLEPWSLKHKSVKKKIAMALFQSEDLKAAGLFFATSHEEFLNIRNLGLKQPVAVIPNGIMLDKSNVSRVSIAKTKNIKTALFLSRIHPKKGLLNLLRAWSKIKPEDWRLKIAGPDEGGHLNEVLAAAKSLDIDSYVEYIGELDGVEKENTYLCSDLFVLPTYSENFGVVVAEALSYGLPVITTKGAPWADLPKHKCGWWIDIGVESLECALKQAMALSDKERQAMGARGKKYVKRYDWMDIAHQTTQVYRWLLGQSSKPDCVHLD